MTDLQREMKRQEQKILLLEKKHEEKFLLLEMEIKRLRLEVEGRFLQEEALANSASIHETRRLRLEVEGRLSNMQLNLSSQLRNAVGNKHH